MSERFDSSRFAGLEQKKKTPAELAIEEERFRKFMDVANGVPSSEHYSRSRAREIEREPKSFELDPIQNPEKFVEEAEKLYAKNELPEWAPPAEMVEQIKQMSPENRQKVEDYLKKGWIAVYMPSQTVQKETFFKAIRNLRPLVMQHGNVLYGHTGGANDEGLVDRMAKKKNMEKVLLKDVPDKPYFELTNPTREVLPNTINKTVEEQRVEAERMKQEDPNLVVMGIMGFVATLVWESNSYKLYMESKGLPPQNIEPIDQGKSLVRFIDLPVSRGGLIPIGSFFRMNGFNNTTINWNVAGQKRADCGFRVSVRVPIE